MYLSLEDGRIEATDEWKNAGLDTGGTGHGRGLFLIMCYLLLLIVISNLSVMMTISTTTASLMLLVLPPPLGVVPVWNA